MDSSLITKNDSPLHTAVRLNQLENVKKILDQGTVDVNALNSRRETALHTACYLSINDSIIELLIAFGADSFIKNQVLKMKLLVKGVCINFFTY